MLTHHTSVPSGNLLATSLLMSVKFVNKLVVAYVGQICFKQNVKAFASTPSWQLRCLRRANFRLRKFVGGGRRIRTFEIADNGFTVRPLWPLGNPSG